MTSPEPAASATDDLVLVLSCPDQPGIVARVSAVLYRHGANIEESQQFDDPVTDHFFMRVRFSVPAGGGGTTGWRERLTPVAEECRMDWDLRRAAEPYRTLVMVSRAGHCLNDLLYRWRTGGLNTDLVAVVSNHRDLEPLATAYDLPFHHVPVTPDARAEAEQLLLDLVDALDVDLVVLARYMQVLSDDLTRAMAGRIINIHHSFLPSFKGARPYHQAFARGVKLVGATAHYVTADLDEGPIIEQDVHRVDHRMTVTDLVRAGEDCESRVLSRAVRWHCDSRVLLNGDRTVVFS